MIVMVALLMDGQVLAYQSNNGIMLIQDPNSRFIYEFYEYFNLS